MGVRESLEYNLSCTLIPEKNSVNDSACKLGCGLLELLKGKPFNYPGGLTAYTI